MAKKAKKTNTARKSGPVANPKGKTTKQTKAEMNETAAKIVTPVSYDPKAILSAQDRRKLERDFASEAASVHVPEADLMTALDIPTDRKSNKPVSMMSTLRHFGQLATKTYNACISLALFEPYRAELMAIGTDADKAEALYNASPEGRELDKLIADNASNDHVATEYKQQKRYMIGQLGKAALILAKKTEAEANGFRFMLKPRSTVIKIFHLSDIANQSSFKVDDLATQMFGGRKAVTELPGKQKRKGRGKSAPVTPGSSEQGKQDAKAKAVPANVPVGFAAVPNTIGLLATAIEKSDDKAKQTMPAEDKLKIAVNLVGIVNLFRPDDVKTVEMKGYVSDVIATLMGLLNISTLAEAKKLATHENDAPKATAKTKAA